jgi:hypothetical protein
VAADAQRQRRDRARRGLADPLVTISDPSATNMFSTSSWQRLNESVTDRAG